MTSNCRLQRKVLNVKYPIVTSYVEHAAFFSVGGFFESVKKWICDNYIQLCVIQNGYAYNPFFFPHNTLLQCPILDKFFVSENSRQLTTIVKEQINAGYYLFTSLDEFYIQPSAYRFHYKHPVFIYGYDDVEEVVYLGDFLYPKQRFEFFRIKYDILNEAYRTREGICNFMASETLRILCFSPRDDIQYEISKERLISFLVDFRDSKNDTNVMDMTLEGGSTKGFLFGLSTYNAILDYLNYYRTNDRKIWLHLFGVPLDQKKIMRFRIQYLTEAGMIRESKELSEIMEELYRFNERALFLAIKYNMTGDTTILNRLSVLVKKMNIYEERMIDRFITVLSD